MKLSKYVEHLQRVLNNEGDLEVVQSSIDSNMEFEFSKKAYAGFILYFEGIEEFHPKQVDVEELEDYPDAVKAFCIN